MGVISELEVAILAAIPNVLGSSAAYVVGPSGNAYKVVRSVSGSHISASSWGRADFYINKSGSGKWAKIAKAKIAE